MSVRCEHSDKKNYLFLKKNWCCSFWLSFQIFNFINFSTFRYRKDIALSFGGLFSYGVHCLEAFYVFWETDSFQSRIFIRWYRVTKLCCSFFPKIKIAICMSYMRFEQKVILNVGLVIYFCWTSLFETVMSCV